MVSRRFLIESTQYLQCHQFAKQGSGGVDGLMAFEGLFAKELYLVHEQTVDERCIAYGPEPTHQRSDNRGSDPWRP